MEHGLQMIRTLLCLSHKETVPSCEGKEIQLAEGTEAIAWKKIRMSMEIVTTQWHGVL